MYIGKWLSTGQHLGELKVNVQSQCLFTNGVQVREAHQDVVVRLIAKALVSLTELRTEFVLDVLADTQEMQYTRQSTRGRVHGGNHEGRHLRDDFLIRKSLLL